MLDHLLIAPRIVLLARPESPNGRLATLLQHVGGATLTTVAAPAALVPQLQAEPADLVVLDLGLQTAGDWALLRSVRAAVPPDTYLPILLVADDLSAPAKWQAIAAGVSDFLTHPFDPVEVILRVGNLLDTRALHLQLQQQMGHFAPGVDAAPR